jgi:hypothetical protein
MGAAEQLPLFSDPLEPRVLPRGGWPFWTLNIMRAGGRMEQHPYRLHQMDFVLRQVRGDIDTYMSQALFSAPCRRALHLAWLTHAYVDLDLYKLPTPPNPGAAGIMLRLFCDDEGIPQPSLIVSSGRGIYLKWCWSTPLPRAAAGRAVAVNRALVKRFEAWGADPSAVDVSRVLRVVGTTNTKSGTRAEILWQAERDSDVLTYDFEQFADEVLPFTLEEVRGFRDAAQQRQAQFHVLSQERQRRRVRTEAEEARKGGRRAFIPEDWHWGVLEDLRTLAALRSADGLVQPGQRDLFGHIGACSLANVIPAGQLWHEIQAWSRIILPAEYAGNEDFRQHSSTLLRNAQRAAQGKTVTFHGRAFSPIYTYRAATIIDRLRITPDEMRHMTRLIDADEKRRRDREATRTQRRAAGVQDRAAYEAAAAERANEARVLIGQLGSIRAVAERLGISYEAAKKRLQRA